MSDMHHENKNPKVFFWDWVAVAPIVPLGLFPSTDRFLAYAIFLIVMAILGFFGVRSSTLVLKLISRLKGRTMYARIKNNR